MDRKNNDNENKVIPLFVCLGGGAAVEVVVEVSENAEEALRSP